MESSGAFRRYPWSMALRNFLPASMFGSSGTILGQARYAPILIA
jgi:hypothetical protein